VKAAMAELKAIINLLPNQELAIRRLARNDPNFAELCDDHAAATGALEHWKFDADRVDEYRQLADELETEIRKALALEKGTAAR
jgi:hypothetical protein